MCVEREGAVEAGKGVVVCVWSGYMRIMFKYQYLFVIPNTLKQHAVLDLSFCQTVKKF